MVVVVVDEMIPSSLVFISQWTNWCEWGI